MKQFKSFYKEANDMSPGWGNYLKKIDVLREKFKNNKRITLKESCWILNMEKFIDSSRYLKFQNWCKKENLFRKRFTFPVWFGLFQGSESK